MHRYTDLIQTSRVYFRSISKRTADPVTQQQSQPSSKLKAQYVRFSSILRGRKHIANDVNLIILINLLSG